MKVIKRNASEVDFDIGKIINAITKANDSMSKKISTEEITDIAEYVEYKCRKMPHTPTVEDIQDLVEKQLMAKGAFELAKQYVLYRYA